MKQQKLSFSFHNPNTAEVTANYLLKLFVEVNRSKVDDAIRQAAQDLPELNAYLPADKPATPTETFAN